MIRTLHVATLALLAPVAVQAQRAVTIAPNATVVAWLPASMLQGTTKEWRDSVREAWAMHLTPATDSLSPAPIPGSMGEVHLQILRNGTLHRGWLTRSTGNAALDAKLMDAARAAARDNAYPTMPAAEDGAGVEAILRVYLPIPSGTRAAEPRPNLSGTLADYIPPAPTGACAATLATPNEWTPMALLASVDTTSGDSTASGWGMRTLSALPEAFTTVVHAAPSVRPDILSGRIGQRLLDGSLRLSVSPTGKVSSAELIGSTGYPAIDSALLGMARRADSLGVIPPPQGLGQYPAILELRFALGGRPPVGWATIGGVEVGEWIPDMPPIFRKPGIIRYPADLRAQRIAGRVMVDYAIGPDGAPIPASVVIRSSPHPAFSAAAATAVRTSGYHPATLKGCPVPMWVQQAVNFRP